MLAAQRFLMRKGRELYWTTTRAVGLERLHGVSLNKQIQEYWGIFLYPVYGFLAFVLRRVGVQFINVPCLQLERIGHFALDIDCYLKNIKLSKKRVYPVLLCPGCKPNQELLSYWSGHVGVVKSKPAIWLLLPLTRFSGLATVLLDYAMVGWQAWDVRLPFAARRGASAVYDVQNRWAGRPPLLRLSDAGISRGRAELKKLGIPEDAWFVCVHSREGGYSPSDEWTHSYRNADIADLREAMRAIVSRGGWCVRVGDKSMTPLEPMAGVVDYAVSKTKSDWMDIFLCASCRFFLGSSSGLYCVAGIFGKPSAVANIAPLACSYSPFPNDIFIPKLVTKTDGSVLTWAQAFAGEACEVRRTPEFVERGLSQINNSPEDIAALAVEMMDRLDGTLLDDPNDDIQQDRFRSLVKPHHYCWKASSRMGRDFLRRYNNLLPNTDMGSASDQDSAL